MTQPPADWYPDPTPATPGQPILRYWDGHAWTDHVAPVPPYQRPLQPKPTTTPDGEALAGWWWRVLAYLIDGVVLSVVGTLLTLPAQIGLQRDLAKVEEEFTRSIEANPEAFPPFGRFFDEMLGLYQDRWFWLIVPGVLIGLAYYGGMLRWRGATLGKLACGLRVRLRDRPGLLPWSAIAVRTGVQLLIIQLLVLVAFTSGSLLVAFLCGLAWTTFALLDPLWATWDAKKQTLHDKAARTNVVRTR